MAGQIAYSKCALSETQLLIACAQSPAALLRPPLRMWNALLAAIGLSPE